MKRVLFLTAVFLIFYGSISAQASYKFYNEVSLPQTDAWNFIKQGDVSPSLYTGTVNLSIPLYTYKDNDFTIPVSLTYSSNGNMPNQRAGVAGPGWTLSAQQLCFFPVSDDDPNRTLKIDKTALLQTISFSGGGSVSFSYDTLPPSRSDQYTKNWASSPENFGDCIRLSSIYYLSSQVDVSTQEDGHRLNMNHTAIHKPLQELQTILSSLHSSLYQALPAV